MGKDGKHKTKSSKTKQHKLNPRNKNASRKQAGNMNNILPPAKMVTNTIPPVNWPASMPYLSKALLTPTLDEAQQTRIHPPISQQAQTPGPFTVNSLVTYSPTTNPLVQIKAITDPSHPAYPQSGLFAAKALPCGSHIVDYTGQIHACPQPSCATSDYDLAFLDRDASIAIDSATMGNEARFVNDYHGIRDGPNAMFEEYHVKVKNSKGGKEVWEARMGIWVLPSKSSQGIAKGEEICVSYGKGWWRARRSLMVGEQDRLEIHSPESLSKHDSEGYDGTHDDHV